MISDEIASALSPFFHEIGPSHDEIGRLFKRAGLDHLDPIRDAGGRPVGKMKRVRGVLFEAALANPDQASKLVLSLIDAVRRSGGFRPGSSNFPGTEAVEALRSALRREGMDLDEEGVVRPLNLESLDGRELSAALWSYVRRARQGAWDATLVLGTAKSLEEAAARYVLKTSTGSYPKHADIPTTMYQAFVELGLATPDARLVSSMSPDPRQAMQQVVLLLALVVNRFRNAEGEGHGRPEVPATRQPEAQMVGLAAALVTQLLLDALDRA